MRKQAAALRFLRSILLLPFRRCIACFAIVALQFFLLATAARASSLLVGTAGSADAALAGSTVAEPLSPLGAYFTNPAGLAGFESRAVGTSIGLAYGKGEVRSPSIGYSASNEVLVPFLETFVVVPHGRWTFGIGSMGTSGARFDYGPRPASGVHDGFFSETGMYGLPLAASWRASETLWLGAELVVLYGTTHLRYSREVAEAPGVDTPFRFTTYGFGVDAMFGVTWRPADGWSVGFSAKPPGRVWSDGDSRFEDGKQDVDLEVEVPARLSLGITHRLATRWKASYAVRWVDSSALGTSYLRFEKTPSANTPFLHGAQDEWRHAVGIEYEWSESLSLLAGFSKSNSIVGRKGVSPMSYDCRDYRLEAGVHHTGRTWTVSGGFGFLFGGTRDIDAGDASVFPGKFESQPAYLLSMTVTRAF